MKRTKGTKDRKSEYKQKVTIENISMILQKYEKGTNRLLQNTNSKAEK